MEIIILILALIIILAIAGATGQEILQRDHKIKHIDYEGGHGNYAKPTKWGTLGIEKHKLIYKLMDKELFTIPLNDILDITYDSAERLTATRMVLTGLLAFAFKKKKHYLIITYKGLKENKVVFCTGNIKQQEFYNNLIVKWNKGV